MKNLLAPEEGVRRIEESKDFPLSADQLARLLETDHMKIRRTARACGYRAAPGKIVRYGKESACKLWAAIHAQRKYEVVP